MMRLACVLAALCGVVLSAVGERPGAGGLLRADEPPATLGVDAAIVDPQEQAIRAAARSLSRAFRSAARRASPAVVTVYSYGQGQPAGGETEPSRQDTDRRDEELAEESDGPGDGRRDGGRPRPPGGADDENVLPQLPGAKPPRVLSDQGVPIPLTGLGSGVIIDPAGRIITNHHVVRDARRVVIQLADSLELVATEVNGDPESDIAVIEVEGEGDLPFAELGDSDAIEIGDWVLAIGSPFKLEATVSAGIISAKDRTIERISRSRMLQTDAAINPGNSGGPLIDLDGRVVAISTAIATRNGGYQGIGFAVPINQAKWIAEELARHGRVRRAAIGVTGVELNRRVAAQVGKPIGLGVLVYQIIDDSAADRAGLRVLDVILEFAGEPVRDPRNLREVIERTPVGSTQPLKIDRDGEVLQLEIVLAPLEDPTRIGEDDHPHEDDRPH